MEVHAPASGASGASDCGISVSITTLAGAALPRYIVVLLDYALVGDDSADLIEEIRSALLGSSIAVMLYGSQARGFARPDSDVDVLQVISKRPRSYSSRRVNVAAYTPEHLTLLAQSGSLFVRHLRDEGKIIYDPNGVLAYTLAEYRSPADYTSLKRELALLFGTISAVHAEAFSAGLMRLAVYSVRTALYIRATELGRLTFDTEQACVTCGVPDLAIRIRSSLPGDAQLLGSTGLGLVRMLPPSGMPVDLPSIAVWSQGQFPLAARLLEGVLAGETQIDYTSLTLPPG